MTDRYDPLTAARRANPRPTGTTGREGEWSAGELLSQIEHRSETVETIERDTRRTTPTGPQRDRGWLLAAAVAALVVLIGAVVIGLQSGSGTDVVEPTPTTLSTPTTVPTPTTAPPPTTAQPAIDRSPLEVTDLYNQAVAAADWAAMRELYADTAELEVVSPPETFLEQTLLSEYQPQTAFDWDGDGLVDGFDGLIDDAARVYAHGTTTFVSCSEVDAVTVACEEVWEGHTFERSSRTPTTWTLTVVDGYITTQILEVTPQTDNPIDTDLVAEYQQWVSENRSPALAALGGPLFNDLFTLAVTPDGVLVHRELVAEWQAQLSPQAFEGTVTWDGEVCTYSGPATIASGDQLTVTYSNASEADEILGYEVGLLEPGSALADYAGFYDPAPADYGWPAFVTLIDTFPTGLDSARNDLALPDRVGVGESGDEVLGALLPLEPGLYGFACLSGIPPNWQVDVAQTGLEVTE